MSYCPLMMAANGLNLGDGPDAKSLNKSRECRADCAWRIGDDCAMVVLAKANAQMAEPAIKVREKDWSPKAERYCINCRHRDVDRYVPPCRECFPLGKHINWEPRA